MDIRNAIIDQIALLASPSEQLQYEKNVPIADIQGELICMFCDDLYHPKNPGMLDEFTENELKDLAHLYGLLVEAANISANNVNELLKQREWRSVIKLAKELNANLSA
jgi:hypothetical protein